jgi:hypothetical protein
MARWGSFGQRVAIVTAPVMLLLAAMAVLSPSAVADPSECDAIAGNLVQNCGFETGSFSPWTSMRSGGGTAVVSTVAHSGAEGAEVLAQNFGAGATDTLSQTVATVPGASYTVGYWLAFVETGGIASVTLSGAVGGPLTLDSLTTDSAGFTHYTHTVTAAASSMSLSFTLAALAGLDDAGQLFVDDVSLVPTVGCDHTYTGVVPGAIIASSGVTCVHDASVGGGIAVTRGASLYVQDSTIAGGIAATKAAAVQVCGSTVASIAVVHSSGMVGIGDPDACAANTVTGSIDAIDNHGGGTIEDNTYGGSVTAAGNKPAFTVSGNHH